MWNLRLEKCSEVKTEDWSMKNLRAVLKGLKSNKARDPLGMANEIFKPNVIGEQLEFALLSLMNGTKSESFIPTIMRLADISSIWKRKASKKDLENDRGIFSLIRLRGILDKLVYNDLYPDIAVNMSNSNIGAVKNKNIRNHLFVVNSVISDVLSTVKKSPIDLSIMDYRQIFDCEDAEICLDALYKAGVQNDIFALITEANRENVISVKTPNGRTEKEYIKKKIMQGDVLGPLVSSNMVDSYIG